MILSKYRSKAGKLLGIKEKMYKIYKTARKKEKKYLYKIQKYWYN